MIAAVFSEARRRPVSNMRLSVSGVLTRLVLIGIIMGKRVLGNSFERHSQELVGALRRLTETPRTGVTNSPPLDSRWEHLCADPDADRGRVAQIDVIEPAFRSSCAGYGRRRFHGSAQDCPGDWWRIRRSERTGSAAMRRRPGRPLVPTSR